MQFIKTPIYFLTLIVALSIASPVPGTAGDRSTKIEGQGILPGTDYNPETEAERIRNTEHGLMNSAVSRAEASNSKHITGSFNDARYLSAMIAHHEGAVDMAKAVIAGGKDPQVKKWAQEVVTAQGNEIATMRAWLSAKGGEDAAAANSMKYSMHQMATTPVSTDLDTNFVSMMLQHHAIALEMASSAVVGSQDKNIMKLSERIIDEQVREIAEYKAWLKAHPRG